MTQVATRPAGRELARAGTWAVGLINWSRLIVRCPNPLCQSALMLPAGWPIYACWDCPTIAAITWPHNLADIAAVLMLRANPHHRSWEPGESLEQVVAANIANGDLDGENLPREGGPVLVIQDGRIVSGHPALTGPIEEARRVIAQMGLADALHPEPDPPDELGD